MGTLVDSDSSTVVIKRILLGLMVGIVTPMSSPTSSNHAIVTSFLILILRFTFVPAPPIKRTHAQIISFAPISLNMGWLDLITL